MEIINTMIVRIISATIFITLNIQHVNAQMEMEGNKYLSKCFDKNIKSMRIYLEGNELSYPVMELGGDNNILFEFDLLGNDANDYVYHIMHCNSKWEQSDLFSDEFMDGFNENIISDYEFSLNTRVNYVHYKVKIPNDDVQLKLSGNYIIRVYENENTEKLVASARFSLYEPLVNVQAEIRQPTLADYTNSGQEVRLSVFHDELQINDPFSEVKINILQNNRPDKMISNIKPVFVKNSELVYSFAGENVLLGGNEYRMFNIRNLQLFGGHVNDIKFVDSVYHVQLRLDERRSYKRYFWQEDLNGKYIVYNSNNDNHEVSADYVYVYFNLPYNEPVLDVAMYVYGGFNNWTLNPENKMFYNFETAMYEGVILLKQGVYNYSYAFVNNYVKQIDESFIEGSHYETENDYLIFVYYNGIEENYDRLVGYQIVNSKYRD